MLYIVIIVFYMKVDLIINDNKQELMIIKELFEGPVGDYCIARNTIKCLFYKSINLQFTGQSTRHTKNGTGRYMEDKLPALDWTENVTYTHWAVLCFITIKTNVVLLLDCVILGLCVLLILALLSLIICTCKHIQYFRNSEITIKCPKQTQKHEI